MKKIIIGIICILFHSYLIAQTYRQLFDKLDESFQNGSFSFYSNFNEELWSNESSFMNAYLNMYEATNDIKYLNEFVIHSKRVIDRRDDNIANASPVYFTAISDCSEIDQHSSQLLEHGKVGWSRKEDGCILYPNFMESGMLTFPMARFVLLALNNMGAFSSITLPDEVNSTISPANYNGTPVVNMYQYAEWLKARVYETLNWHYNNDWNAMHGWFESPYTTDKSFNHQCAIGRTYILMNYIAYMYDLPNDPSMIATINAYTDVTEVMANILNAQLNDSYNNPPSPATVGNGLPWYSWYHEENHSGYLWEDISHAYLDEEFVELYFNYFHPVSGYSTFDITDMQKFANGFAYRVIPDPLDFRMTVNGTNCNCDQMCTTCPNNNIEKYYQSMAYVFLTKYNGDLNFNNDIYQEISDFFFPGTTFTIAGSTHSLEELAPKETLLAYSLLAKYENLFNPIAVKRDTWADSYWAGVAGGDFDGDGTEEFCTARNKEGAIEIYELNSANQIIQRSSIVNHTNPWSGITATDLDVSNPGYEIAAINDNDGYIYLYKETNSSTITQFSSFQTGITNGTWTGIASGNFDGNAGNEIILSNDNGRVYVYHYNGTALVADAINTGSNFINSNLAGITVGNFDGNPGDEIATINNSENGNIEITIYSFASSTLTQLSIFSLTTGSENQWNGITSGDFDGDGIDEIIAHRNYDGDFFIFKLNDQAQIINNYKESFPVNWLNGVIGAARFSFDQTKDALISLRNYDGNMFIYNLEGLCQSLSVNDVTIDDSYTIDNTSANIHNNYTVDYHASNNIKASNFKAGNSIVLKPGFSVSALNNGSFHAFIETNDLDVVIIDPVTNPGYVGKYEKFEAGLKLPVDITAQINKLKVIK